MDWRAVRYELSALAATVASLPTRLLPGEAGFDACAPHPTPVVLVHGFLGDASNFFVFRRRLAAHGIRNVATFSYRPGIDMPRLALRLAGTLEDARRAAGTRDVDVIGHSLGGTVARYLAETDGGQLVRRLVTLGAPSFTSWTAAHELAIFGAADPLVPPPATAGPHGRVRVVAGCGHIGLLYHPVASAAAACHLRRPLVRASAGSRAVA